jgi:Fe-S-cluster containining protein
LLDESAAQPWNDFANDEPCPALDPEAGTCDLYEARPMICRTFGPPVRSEGELGVCELCFVGATDEEVSASEMHAAGNHLEAALLNELESTTGARGETIVAFALAPDSGKSEPRVNERTRISLLSAARVEPA